METGKQKIIPCLWFDNQTEEAMNFYVSAFSKMPGDGRTGIISIQRYEEGMETPGIENMLGKILTGIFDIKGYQFMALDGGPMFKINPSVSFMLNFDPSRIEDAEHELHLLWEKFSDGGRVMMELKDYQFSNLYGWIQDKYGVNWQLILTNPEGDPRPFIIPSLLYSGKVNGKAEEALNFYTTVFKNSRKGMMEYYPAGMEANKEGNVMYSDFVLENQWFAAMDSGLSNFSFNEAISFVVNCAGQYEVDQYWERLSHVPESEVCGWLKDKYGFSWQIVPDKMNELLSGPDKEKVHRVLNRMLQMKKIEISELENAYEVIR
jgi:predicted 3-demethylubiquinone-9 3-methyltransferase (glyoxalase superfamily)